MNSTLLQFARMDVRTTRHTKLLQLIDEYETIERLASVSGQNSSYLSQIKNKTRGMGHTTARGIERGLGLPDGWMDTADSRAPSELISKELVYFRKLTREQREAVVLILESMIR